MRATFSARYHGGLLIVVVTQFVTALRGRIHVLAALAAMAVSTAASGGAAAEAPKAIDATTLPATVQPAMLGRDTASPSPRRLWHRPPDPAAAGGSSVAYDRTASAAKVGTIRIHRAFG
jgi:hypothetical protein